MNTKKLLYKGLKSIRVNGVPDTILLVADYIQNRQIQKLVFLPFIFQGKILRSTNGILIQKDILNGTELAIPHTYDHTRIEEKYEKSLRNKYFDSGVVGIEKEDIVFDVGAYIGVSSIIAAEKAKKVYAIEPSPRARKCLEYNTKGYDNIEILPYAAWNQSEKIELEYGMTSSEDSLIEPDGGGRGQSVTVQAHTISTIMDIEGIDNVDFLKVEAEGVEPEIIEGIGKSYIEKVVSTGNAERFGETTYEEVSENLVGLGYDVCIDANQGYMVYGKK